MAPMRLQQVVECGIRRTGWCWCMVFQALALSSYVSESIMHKAQRHGMVWHDIIPW